MGEYRIPRIMIAAQGSGSGKTMISCGLLQLMKEKYRTLAFKCGPDYIDPMFHRTVLGTPSRNLDSWLSSSETVCGILAENAAKADAALCVIEGVMGYYDGLGGNTTLGSTYEVSVITQTPVILVVDAAGTGLSLAAQIRGFLAFREDHRIRGVILNRCTDKVFAALRPVIEEELGLAALGYIPRQEEIRFPGRHLGLMMPEEIRDLRRRIEAFACNMEKTVDLEHIMTLAQTAPAMEMPEHEAADVPEERVRIGVAKDEAFCFYYEENLDMLRRLGAEIVPFSPMHDRQLPERLDGLYIGGGYPELHAQALSDNHAMRAAVKEAVAAGMPCLAECGAFMYLKEEMEDAEGYFLPMAGVIPGKAFRCSRLVRFGYCELTAQDESILGPAGTTLRAHEFHYWDSDNSEGVFTARKPGKTGEWRCMVRRENLLAGFPHLYFPGAPQAAKAFVKTCRTWRNAEQRL